jgi:formylglycine-generating enzyme required for sulfatase activity/DNA polymerase III delta prime subunit
VGKEVVKPLTGPLAEQVEAWARRGYDAKVDGARVRKAVEAAARTTGLWEGLADHYRLTGALHRLAEPGQDTLRESTVAAALAMKEGAPEEVPDELLKALDVDAQDRSMFARFLWAFRNALAQADEEYRALVELAGEDETRALLRRLASVVRDVDGRPVILVLPVIPAEREIEEAYLYTLVESEFRFLPLEGRRVQSPEGGLRMRLENVYIALDTTGRPEEEARMRGLEFAAEGRERQAPCSALRVALDYRHLLLLGEPGSGKTTFAEHLALCLAGERWRPETGWASNLVSHDTAWDGPAPLPVRIRLREFGADEECLPEDTDSMGRARHLLAYVDKYLGDNRWSQHLPGHAVQLINRGQAFLVLDGLDEVVDPHRRRQVAEAISDLAGRRPDLWMLVTCRVAQYPLDASGRCAAEWALPGFRTATLADFTPQQIESFVDRWFGELYSSPQRQQVRREKAKTLKAAIRDRPDLQDIALRPILLTQMALVHDAGELPGTRVELYEECTRLLLWEWERIRAEQAGRHTNADRFIQGLKVPGLQRLHLQKTLDHAVFQVHREQGAATAGPVEIPSATLEAHLTTRFISAGLEQPEAQTKAAFFVSEFLGQRNGLIVPAGERSFQTPHRTFQEFLAARHLQSLSKFHREVAERVRDNYDLWHEVVVLAVGLAGRTKAWHAVDAIYHLCPEEFPRGEAESRQLILAGEALAEVGTLTVRGEERGSEVERRVVGFLKRTMQDTDPDGLCSDPAVVPIPTRYAAGEVLDRMGWLPDDLDTWVEIQIPNPKSQTPKRIYVARYPVTNVQFERFIAAGGYEERERRWWSDEGWEWRTRKHPDYRGEGPVTQPEYWDNPRFGKSRRGYPVVGVSWYEANAYCAWLGEELQVPDFTFQVWREGKLETLNLEPGTLTVRLPTDEEWIAAAGGEEGDRYPWGPEWHESRANTSEGGIGGTSLVAMYPAGRSERYEVWDMGGNVWEWTASRVEGVEREAYTLRGGSWHYNQEHARVRGRLRNNPDNSYPDRGFRVVVSPAGSEF